MPLVESELLVNGKEYIVVRFVHQKEGKPAKYYHFGFFPKNERGWQGIYLPNDKEDEWMNGPPPLE